MAGLKPTPAEEMDIDYSEPPQSAPVRQPPATPKPKKSDKERIAMYLEELGVD
jgi:hypothetical protein